jgi:hypothetical protein
MNTHSGGIQIVVQWNEDMGEEIFRHWAGVGRFGPERVALCELIQRECL